MVTDFELLSILIHKLRVERNNTLRKLKRYKKDYLDRDKIETGDLIFYSVDEKAFNYRQRAYYDYKLHIDQSNRELETINMLKRLRNNIKGKGL